MDPSTPYLTSNYSILDDLMNANFSMNQPHQDYYAPLGQSLNPSIIPNAPPPVHAQREDDQKKMEARRCKIAREQRRQILRLRSTRASKAPEDTIMRPPNYRDIQKRTPHVFFTSDGKVIVRLNYFSYFLHYIYVKFNTLLISDIFFNFIY